MITSCRRYRSSVIFWVSRLNLLLLFAMPWLTHAEESALQLLEKMASAEQYLDYEGTFIYVSGTSVKTMQVVHGFDQHGERERLTSLTGSTREIVKDDQHFFYVMPEKKVVLVETREGLDQHTVFVRESIHGNPFYHYDLGKTERVANYLCRNVSILPTDTFRYGHRVCIENKTGLLLKSQTLDGSGKPVEEMIFTHLKLPESIPTEHFQTTMHRDDYALLESEASTALSVSDEDEGWGLTEAPPGFSVKLNTIRHIASSALPVRHIVLDDGVVSISIFIARLTKEGSYSEGVMSSGALNVASRVVDNFVVTVMGGVPGKTVQQVAGALVHHTRAQ